MLFITDESELIIKNNITTLYFYAPWYTENKQMIAILKKFEEKYKDLTIFAIDTDYFKKYCKIFNVDSIPQIITLYNKEEVSRIVGVVLTSTIKSHYNIIHKRIKNKSLDNLYKINKLKLEKEKENMVKVTKSSEQLDQLDQSDSAETNNEVVEQPVAPKKAVKNKLDGEAAKIWAEIKDVKLELFGLPNQFVSGHVTALPVDPTKLFLTLKAGAVLAALETAISSKFNVEQQTKYTVVTRK